MSQKIKAALFNRNMMQAINSRNLCNIKISCGHIFKRVKGIYEINLNNILTWDIQYIIISTNNILMNITKKY